jgi:hypothetical protein
VEKAAPPLLPAHPLLTGHGPGETHANGGGGVCPLLCTSPPEGGRVWPEGPQVWERACVPRMGAQEWAAPFPCTQAAWQAPLPLALAPDDLHKAGSEEPPTAPSDPAPIYAQTGASRLCPNRARVRGSARHTPLPHLRRGRRDGPPRWRRDAPLLHPLPSAPHPPPLTNGVWRKRCPFSMGHLLCPCPLPAN